MMLSSKDMIVFDAFHRFWFHRVCHVLKTQYEPNLYVFGLQTLWNLRYKLQIK